MPKRTQERMVVGIAWFDREQWQRLTEVVEDRSELDDTFEQWESSALQALRNLEHQGQRVEKVFINVNALHSWCKERALPVNGKSRAQYVSSLLQEREGQAEV